MHKLNRLLLFLRSSMLIRDFGKKEKKMMRSF